MGLLHHEKWCEFGWIDLVVERLDSLVVVERRDSSVVGRLEVVCFVGVGVVPVAYLRGGATEEAVVAIVAQDPVAGNKIEGAGDEVQVLGLGLRWFAVRTSLLNEEWTSWGPNTSCRNPHFLGVGTRSLFDKI